MYQLKRWKEIGAHFEKLLTFSNSNAVTKNYLEKSLNNMLEYVTTNDDLEFMERIYSTTLEALEQSNNERFWIKIGLKLAKLYIDLEAVTKADELLKRLVDKCQDGDSGPDNTKGTYLLELYSLQIQLCTLTNDNRTLSILYTKSLNVKSAIPHPRISGIIRECGGKMLMRAKQWDAAREAFFESFKNYDEAGSLQRVQVLKYYVLACMLSESGINPFESQETKPYKNDPQISAMVQLVEAFQSSDVDLFNKLLKSHESEILGDRFIRTFLDDVIHTIRLQGLVNSVLPYSKVSFHHMASTLSVDVKTIQSMLINLILDGRLPAARINMVYQYLELNQSFPNVSSTGHSRPKVSAKEKTEFKLPIRYSESEVDAKQQLEQQSLVKSSKVEGLNTSGSKKGNQLNQSHILGDLISAMNEMHRLLNRKSWSKSLSRKGGAMNSFTVA